MTRLWFLAPPARFRITDFGDDYVLGVWRGELDVERVRMCALIKPGRNIQ
jgi:hypothetical protein